METPPPTFTPRRFPAESDDPALKPPPRLVAVRIPRGAVGLCCTFGSTDGRGRNELRKEVVCRIIMNITSKQKAVSGGEPANFIAARV
jgi:hypothetical protein